MKQYLVFLLLLTAVNSSYGQPVMVADLYPGSIGSKPLGMTQYREKLVFAAMDATHGYELWQYTPSSQNPPTLVADINPGQLSAFTGGVRPMAVLNGILYFPANDGVHGMELFKWDGINPPVLAKDIIPGPDGAAPRCFAVLNGILYFAAYIPSSHVELWKYDPATNVASQIADIHPNSVTGAMHDFVTFSNKIYFSAQHQGFGSDFFVYDPTTNIVSPIIIAPGSKPSASGLKVIGNDLYFSAYDPAYGKELYMMNTAGQITRLTDFRTGFLNGVSDFAELNGRIYFLSTDSDTTWGTVLFEYQQVTNTFTPIHQFSTGTAAPVMGLTRVNDMLYFSGWNKKLGRELWKFDGLSVSIVADIYADSMGSGPAQFTVFDNTVLFFTAENRTTGRELYQLGDAVVKVKDVRTTDAPHIFPNPTADEVNISLNLTSEKQLNVSITDISGKTVYKSKSVRYTASEVKITIPVNDLVPGTYILHVYDEQGNKYATGKFVKE